MPAPYAGKHEQAPRVGDARFLAMQQAAVKIISIYSSNLKVSLAAEVVDVLHQGDLLRRLDDPALNHGVVEGRRIVRRHPVKPFHAGRRRPSLAVDVVALVEVNLWCKTA